MASVEEFRAQSIKKSTNQSLFSPGAPTGSVRTRSRPGFGSRCRRRCRRRCRCCRLLPAVRRPRACFLRPWASEAGQEESQRQRSVLLPLPGSAAGATPAAGEEGRRRRPPLAAEAAEGPRRAAAAAVAACRSSLKEEAEEASRSTAAAAAAFPRRSCTRAEEGSFGVAADGREAAAGRCC